MFGAEVRKLLVEVVTSWQVLVVTGVLVVYVFLVNYVAAVYHHARRQPRPPRAKGQPGIPAGGAKAAPAQETDELGLEEDAASKK